MNEHHQGSRNRLERLFDDLVWPAVTGNGVWSLFTILVAGPLDEWPVRGRAITVALIGAYMAYEWMYEIPQQRSRSAYHLFDGFHLAAMVWFVLAVQDASTDSGYLCWSFAAIVIATALGNFLGAWEDRWTISPNKTPLWRLLPRQKATTFANLVGGLPLLVYALVEESRPYFPAHLAVAVFIAFVGFVLADRKYPR